MSHSHYVMDLYYADGKAGAVRREVLRIAAGSDSDAMNEASRINGWRQPDRYEVRAITKAARANHRLVYASIVAEDEGQPPASSAGAESAPDVDSSPRRDGVL